jgi:hypothetical protein
MARLAVVDAAGAAAVYRQMAGLMPLRVRPSSAFLSFIA